MVKLIILIGLLAGKLIAQEAPQKELLGYDAKTDVIADNYEAGPFLIYDCVEKHWVCVLENYYKECQEKRLSDMSEKNVVTHTCAPLGEFPNKKSCFQRMLFMTTHHYGQRFCLKDNWKEKNISY